MRRLGGVGETQVPRFRRAGVGSLWAEPRLWCLWCLVSGVKSWPSASREGTGRAQPSRQWASSTEWPHLLPGFVPDVLLLFIYLFFALGLRCCAWAFSSCGERGLLFVVVHRFLIAVASRCRARALGTRAQ